jgi:hypothetical protein
MEKNKDFVEDMEKRRAAREERRRQEHAKVGSPGRSHAHALRTPRSSGRLTPAPAHSALHARTGGGR